MKGIIKQLPDFVINQIAAGEVIQRPASALKELLENSIDAGGDKIKIIIKDAGKTLVQVIDNGCGMSESDANQCFDRHATSKISKADDLFKIRTMGFRGEALASIASVAQVELKTKRIEDEIGYHIYIEGSKIVEQGNNNCQNGTSIAVKNLFFNIPARRNFLKSNAAEYRNIIEQFFRISIANPEIEFSFIQNEKEIYHLQKSNLKKRIVDLIGKQYAERLVPVEQETQNVNITGYIGKPEFAKKTRGEQYFFVNNRYIRHPYLHHSLNSAFQELIPSDSFPSYFLFFDVDPTFIDINIHPTKIEVNFQDAKLIYAVLHSAVKQALGKFNISPTLDFDQDPGLIFPANQPETPPRAPEIKVNPDYNPFLNSPTPTNKNNTLNWGKLYQKLDDKVENQPIQHEQRLFEHAQEANADKRIFQIYNRYIVSPVKSGLMVIDQQRAHEKILFEKFSNNLELKTAATQKKLFPQHVSFSSDDSLLVKEIIPDLNHLGFEIEEFGTHAFIVTGMPAELPDQDTRSLFERFIEDYKTDVPDSKADKRLNIAKTMAHNLSIPYGKVLKIEEMQNLVDSLFSCQQPDRSPDGKRIVLILTIDELKKRFN